MCVYGYVCICQMDPILAQGAGLAIETAYGLAETLASAGVVTTSILSGTSGDANSHRVESNDSSSCGSGSGVEGSEGERGNGGRDNLQKHIIDFNTAR
jgi:hypothetical protein